jgi:hypothetical protein
MSIQRPIRVALSGILGACALGSAVADEIKPVEAKPVIDGALAHCATIAGRDDRLACYDSLAGRRPDTPTPHTQFSKTQPAPVPTQPVPAPTQPVPAPTKEDFGLTVLQTRKTGSPPPQIQSIDALVKSIGQSTSGRMLITLDNGQSWELDSPDVLLAAGSAVSIQRAALGSFLLTTSLKRTHRVRRIH